MIHHDSRSYKEAASAAAKQARVKMEDIIHRGVASAETVINRVLETTVSDSIVRTNGVIVKPDPVVADRWRLYDGDSDRPMHHHAFSQVLADTGVRKTFVDDVMAEAKNERWGTDLVAHNVNTILSHRKSRNLVRAEGGTVKGWLSDKYRRIDSRPLLESFVTACQEMGLQPIQGVGTDTKVRVRAVLPRVFEPVENEVMLFGLEWGNSDFGDGGHVVNLWTMRIWCTNLAITDSCLRQVHLGPRLKEGIAYSQDTYDKDTAANSAALRDVVKDVIGPGRLNNLLDGVKAASENEIQGKDVQAILKKHLGKGDAERIQAAYESPDVVNLPAGNTQWRLSNAISWIANAKDVTPEKKLELETLAGSLIPHTAVKAREV
jgi:hypothetical protein